MRKTRPGFFASGIGATALALGLTVFTATAANAATNCYSQGVQPGDPVFTTAQDGVWYCHYLPNGNLCLRYINGHSGVDIHYDKLAGGSITADFCYDDDIRHITYQDGGDFTVNPPWPKYPSYAWNNTLPSHEIIGHMWVQGQGEFDTPLLRY